VGLAFLLAEGLSELGRGADEADFGQFGVVVEVGPELVILVEVFFPVGAGVVEAGGEDNGVFGEVEVEVAGEEGLDVAELGREVLFVCVDVSVPGVGE